MGLGLRLLFDVRITWLNIAVCWSKEILLLRIWIVRRDVRSSITVTGTILFGRIDILVVSRVLIHLLIRVRDVVTVMIVLVIIVIAILIVCIFWLVGIVSLPSSIVTWALVTWRLIAIIISCSPWENWRGNIRSCIYGILRKIMSHTI